MELSNLKPAVKKVARKRVGRGTGSGLGKTSGKGHKGQKARSGGGVRPGFEGGQTPLFRRLPKRGFKNIPFKKNMQEVTLNMLNLSTVEEVDAKTLIADGIISKEKDGIVILATGKLEKKLSVKASRFTKKAAEAIVAAGGKLEVISLFKTIINAWKVPEVRKRLLFTILLLIIFRFGTHVSVPFVNFARLDGVMNTANNGLLGMFNLITGGAFARLSVFAMSISPYISASIIVQLLGMLLPSLEMMMKEGGEQGKQKINRYTKIITFILALIQGAGLYIAYSRQGLFVNPGWMTGITVVMSFLAGTAFLVWLGEKITKNGIGNGISMLIFAGIVASLPNEVIRLVSRNNIFCRTN